MKRYIAMLLALIMVLSFMSGCSQAEADAAVSTESAVEVSEETKPPEEAATEPAEENSEASVVEASLAEETAVEFTGAVIDAETCQANGYDVEHGMYDWETYVELPLVDEEESFSYWMAIQPFMLAYNNFEMSNTTFFRELEARTGVHMDISATPVFTATEQFSLMVASGEYAEILDGASSYYSGGSAQLLTDEIGIDLLPYEEYLPNYMAWLKADPAVYVSALTYEGQLAEACEFTGRERNVGPMLRGDWLDALGLEIPVTYDDYHDVLTAMKDAYGATLWLNTSGSARDNALCAGYDIFFNQEDSDSVMFVDGVATYAPATENYREFLRLMNQWWDEGLIYGDFASQSADANPDSSLIANNKISMWVGDSNNLYNWEALTDEIDITCTPFPVKEEGQTYKIFSTSAGAGGGTLISSQCENVELACRWLDYLYTYEGFLLGSYGVEGEGLTFDEDGNPMYSDLVLNNPDMIVVACSVMYSKYGGAGIVDEMRFSPSYSDEQLAAIELWNNQLGDGEYVVSGNLKRTVDETATYAALYTDLSTYAEQCSLQFLTGTLSLDDDWDAYIQQLEELGLEEFLVVCQDPYDRYVETMSEIN